MNKSPKLLNSFSHIVPKAEPLTLKEVLIQFKGLMVFIKRLITKL